MHYYKRNLGDYAKKAGRLSMLQHGAYTLLIDTCYDREQFPTEEEAIEWTWASTEAEIEAVKFVLKRFFTFENGVYVQNRIKEEIDLYHDKSEKNKQIAIEREGLKRERARNVKKEERIVQGRSPNQEPITNNQEPIKDLEITNVISCEKSDDEFVKKPKRQKDDPIPYQEIIDLYQEKLPMLNGVYKLTDDRKTKIRILWKTSELNNLEHWGNYFLHVGKSKFLTGRGPPDKTTGRVWKADLDFLINQSNFVKISEDKYHG
jgi:uncharacterized protein YdaU (DUF1376 family)